MVVMFVVLCVYVRACVCSLCPRSLPPPAPPRSPSSTHVGCPAARALDAYSALLTTGAPMHPASESANHVSRGSFNSMTGVLDEHHPVTDTLILQMVGECASVLCYCISRQACALVLSTGDCTLSVHDICGCPDAEPDIAPLPYPFRILPGRFCPPRCSA